MRPPGDPALALLVVHAAATWFMAGLIWTIQVVHYPGFAAASGEGFTDFHAQHGTRISALPVLPWAIEAVAAGGVVLVTPAGVPDRLTASELDPDAPGPPGRSSPGQ